MKTKTVSLSSLKADDDKKSNNAYFNDAVNNSGNAALPGITAFKASPGTRISVNEDSEEEREKNVGGLGAGLKYLGLSALGGAVRGAEGVVDYTVGGLANLFGGNAGKKYAERLMSNNWYDYDAARRKFNPGTGWSLAGDVAGGVGQSVFSIGVNAGVTLATGGVVNP